MLVGLQESFVYQIHVTNLIYSTHLKENPNRNSYYPTIGT